MSCSGTSAAAAATAQADADGDGLVSLRELRRLGARAGQPSARRTGASLL